jgi:hypothetical protein
MEIGIEIGKQETDNKMGYIIAQHAMREGVETRSNLTRGIHSTMVSTPEGFFLENSLFNEERLDFLSKRREGEFELCISREVWARGGSGSGAIDGFGAGDAAP